MLSGLDERSPTTPVTARTLAVFALYAFLFFWLIFVYKAARWLAAPEGLAEPLRNAEWIMDVERALFIFVEPEIQELTQSAGLEPVAAWLYTAVHQPAYVGFFVLLWFLLPRLFMFVWLWFWVTNFLSALIFWIYPLAPPRLVPTLGLDDPTHSTLQLGGSTTWLIQSDFRNIYAAMPSLHIGYPILFATVIYFVVRGRPFAWAVWIYPLLMLWAVVATANHFFLDAVGGAMVVAVSAGVVALALPRLERPWSRRAAVLERRTFEPKAPIPD